MTTFNEKIVDISTGQEIIKELSKEQIAELNATKAKLDAEIVRLETENAAKATAKAELLAQLGITEDQAKLLLS